ncbi:hypothetical protein GALL_469390 [mine drainage metagenome]|uniref:Uncharacterized protein n=1 Tax=mine drainage metagenome TaxID=410659 RepID=A0A1J5PJT9_9ZZZZ
MDRIGGFGSSGDVQVAAARGAAADENRVVILGEELLQAIDPVTQAHFGAKSGDVADFLVNDFFRQTEFRNLRADHAARPGIPVIDDDMITQRCQVAGHCQGRRTGADQGDLLAVARGRGLGHQAADIALHIRRDSLQAADRDRFFLDTAAPAGGFTGAVAGTAENPGEYVRLPVDHIGVGVAAGSDQTDVFGNRRVCWTGPLTIDHFMEVVGILDVGRIQWALLSSGRTDLRWQAVF